MRPLQALLGLALLAAPSLADGNNFELSLNLPNYTPGEDIVYTVKGNPGQMGFLLFDSEYLHHEVIPGVVLDLALSPALFYMPVLLPASGSMELLCGLDCELGAMIQARGSYIYSQGIAITPATGEINVSNLVTVDVSNTYGFCSPCNECEGEVTSLTLRYTGEVAKYVEIKSWNNWHLTTHFGQTLQPNEIFTVTPVVGAWCNGSFGEYIKFYTDGWKQAYVKADCSKPIGPGAIYGDFRVLASTSSEGGAICPEEPQAPPSNDCTGGRPSKLVMKYTGGSCVDSDNDQNWDCSCTGDVDGRATVKLKVKNLQTGQKYFEGHVGIDGTFAIDAAVLGAAKLADGIRIDMYETEAGKWGCKWLGSVTFDATCNQGLAVGDVFGPIELVTFIN